VVQFEPDKAKGLVQNKMCCGSEAGEVVECDVIN
jgi:hypothetical protein